MDHRITQCPRCGTSFRVTEAHLAVAAGAVRCGSCLHIFNAREHWVDTSAPAAAEPEKPLAARQIEEIDIDDDALFDDDTPLFGDEEIEPAPSKTNNGSIFSPVDEDFEIIDDSGPEKFSESFLEINSWEEDSGHSFGGDNSSASSAEDESSELTWTQKLLEEDTEIAAPESSAPARSALIDDFDSVLGSVPEVEETESAADTQNDSSELSEEFLNLDADYSAPSRDPLRTSLSATEEGTAALTAEPVAAASAQVEQPLMALRDLEPEPIRLHQFVHESRWPKILWRTGFVVALALGIWQYIYFNFDELARSSMRPWLARACGALNCILPPQADTSQIRTNSLIVRSHPTQRGALAVDAIITNLADFPQPYPSLQLQFNDLNGTPVAGRRFQPEEYLSGELTGAHLMPVRQPVHIALEIVDPGARAVNYQLTVVAPASEQ